MRKEFLKAYIAVAIVSVVWGTTYLASRVSALHIPGLFVSGVRQFISGFILVSFFLARGHALPRRSAFVKIGLQGILLLCIANGMATWAAEYISSGLSAIIGALVPIFIALFSILFLKVSKLTIKIIVGLLAGITGIAIIFYDHLYQLFDRKFSFGIALAVASTIAWSFGTVYTSKNKPGIHILFSVGLQMLTGGLCMLVICFASGKYINLFEANHDALLGLGYLIVFGSLITYSAFVFAISKLPATQVSVYAYINPVIAVALGGVLLNEHLSINIFIGTVITLAGVYLVNSDFKKHLA